MSLQASTPPIPHRHTRRACLTAALSGLCLCLSSQSFAQTSLPAATARAALQTQSSNALRSAIAASTLLPFTGTPFVVQPPNPAWQSGAVSWLTTDASGNIYELQRGDADDPILVISPSGHLLRSWGKGDFKIPHSIRLDPNGNIWTVDAGSSTIIQWSPLGKKLLTIDVGERPENGNPFNGTTDIAFAPNGHLFITDGYGNARVLEYSPTGQRLRQWGTPGTAPGQFHLPHSIQISPSGTIYIADRENGRIQLFDLSGHFLREFPNLGRAYSIQLSGNILWVGTGPLDKPIGDPGWILKLDAHTGKILGYLNLPAPHSGHGIGLTPASNPITTSGNQALWFKPQ